MPEVPTPKELKRIWRRMELVERHRLSKIAGAGRVADDPADAALVTALVRRGLRGLPWLIVLMLVLFGFQVITIATTDDRVVHWLSVAVMVIIPASIAKILLRDRPRLLRAERLNRELAGGGDSGTH
jgi:hypothetical protein